MRSNACDVVVVGGGAAGLSGALMLARMRRSVVVIDAGAPRNAPAEGVHGLLALDGIRPAELLERGREDVRRYGGQIVAGEVDAVTRGDSGFIDVGFTDGGLEDGAPTDGKFTDGKFTDGGFTVRLRDGRTVRARRLLVATGLVDELPEVRGLRARWGRDVVHCPYCHGWEVRDRAIGVLATGPQAMHQALLFRQLSSDVVVFAHTTAPPAGADAEQLAARGIRVVPGEVASLEIVDDRLVGVRLRDGAVVGRDVLAVASRMVARAGFLAALGLRPVPHPMGVGEHIPADATGRTGVPGVWVAGNVTDLVAQVGTSAAAGAIAAAHLNADLVAEEARLAVAANHRDPFTPEREARLCEAVMGNRRHGL